MGQWFLSLHQVPGGANKAFSVLQAAIRYGQRLGVYDGPNPADRLRHWPRPTRSRYLDTEQLGRLWHALNASSLRIRLFFTLQILTGCRPCELRYMRWADLDCSTGLWRKPTSKTGQPHVVPIPRQGLELLWLASSRMGWVFPGMRTDAPIAAATVRKNWMRIRAKAGLPDVWNYDLRRTCASHLAMKGVNLPTIQHVLNHASLQPTSIYARLNVETVTKALQAQADGWNLGASLSNERSAFTPIRVLSPTTVSAGPRHSMVTHPTHDHLFVTCPLDCQPNLQISDITLDEGPLLRCPTCGHLLCSCTRQQHAHAMARWDTSGGTDPEPGSAVRYSQVITRRLRKARQLLGRRPAALRLLDVGCSSGALLAIAAQLGFSVAGVELAAIAARTARDAGFAVFCSSLQQAHFPERTFDVITAFELIEHLENPVALLQECRRILKPDGIVLLNTSNGASWTAQFMKERWEGFHLTAMGGHVSFLGLVSIRVLAQQC